ncbi:GNAT family N-acetyltransferase [Paenibacillus sp. GCM10027627]|uniref:GNAT family N-acetyltransferase n=1 Tax=unclassified Paenibacillus TaxID=185978 RepID=UPI0036255CB7
MKIEFATETDYKYILERDRHLHESLILPKIKGNEIYIFRNDEGEESGWMRYGYFWDNIPFLNLIWVDESHRAKGAGREAVLFWEAQMKEKGYEMVMTSTQADEEAQHFYRKLGYKDSGCLVLDTQPMEIILIKKLCIA